MTPLALADDKTRQNLRNSAILDAPDLERFMQKLLVTATGCRAATKGGYVKSFKSMVAAALVCGVLGSSVTPALALEPQRHGGQRDDDDRGRRGRDRDDRDRDHDRRDRDRDRDHHRYDRDRDHDRDHRRYDHDRGRGRTVYVVPQQWRYYDYNRYEPGYRRYDAARYYRWDDRYYRQRRMGRYDRIYRGYDNRYYCRRDDGTTGLIVGGILGGVLGNVIAPGDSKVLGTIIGAGGGAIIGREIDRGDIVCR
jgi:hypothetical protein